MQHQKWRNTFFLILKSNTLQSLVAIENQSLEIQMYTYFIVAKRYACCRLIFFNIKIGIVISFAHWYLFIINVTIVTTAVLLLHAFNG